MTEGTTDTVGGGAKVGITLFKVLEIGADAKAEYQILHQTTASVTADLPVPPAYTGEILRSQVVRTVTGWLWYTGDSGTSYRIHERYEMPVPEGTDGVRSQLLPTTTRLTSRAQLTSLCPNWTFPWQSIADGTTLKAGWSVQANLTRLVMQNDGNLVMYRLRDGKAIWATGTWGHPGAYAVMQKDGNFVIYDANNSFLWNSNTAWSQDSPGAWAVMQDDGNFVIYKLAGGPGRGGALWATNTTAAAK
ncbi:hypothetical protein [Streptomyces sp. NPDC048191]|uniref:hypothetical protein n=1 Tax=Streptomyces sp. NPDC048191 TaxID=3155484 RepID=UPI0033CDA42A